MTKTILQSKFLATALLSSILLISMIAASIPQQVLAEPNNSEVTGVIEEIGVDIFLVTTTVKDPDGISKIVVKISDGSTTSILNTSCETEKLITNLVFGATKFPLTVLVTDCQDPPATDEHTVPDEPTKEQLKAIDKSNKAIEKACDKITIEITTLETIGQTIPIEIEELQLRACGP